MTLKDTTQDQRNQLLDAVANVFRFEEICRRRVRHVSSITFERSTYRWWQKKNELPDAELLDALHAVYGKTEWSLTDFLSDLEKRHPECICFGVIQAPEFGFGEMIKPHGDSVYFLNLFKAAS